MANVAISLEDAKRILHASTSGILTPLDVTGRLSDAIDAAVNTGPDPTSTAFRPEGCTCGGHTTASYVVHFTDRPCYVVPDTHSECRDYVTELRNRAQVHG
jgi:hypothetical protein